MINYPVIRLLNTFGVFILVAAAIYYLWFIKKEEDEAVRVVISVLVASAFAISLKEFFNTPRPFFVSKETAMAGLSQLPSFPSLHSAIAFAAATSVTFQGKKFGIFLLFAASLLAAGRVLANVHYPVDIFFGIMKIRR
jgi:undecaprenyl-diphosphatase